MTFDAVGGVEPGYAQISTTKRDLKRPIDALTAAGIAEDRIYLDRKSGASTDRPGLTALLDYGVCAWLRTVLRVPLRGPATLG